jgi:hypothetical protein
MPLPNKNPYKVIPYTNWHQGKQGRTHCVQHKKAMVNAGYNKATLHIQRWSEIVGAPGKMSSRTLNYRVVGRE